jgi:cytochrome c553
MPPEPTIHARTWIAEDVVVEKLNWGQKPEEENNMHGTIGVTARGLSSGETNQRPPDIEPAIRPPPDQDRCRRRYGYDLKGCGTHQLKGCRRGRCSQTRSAKGVLDIGYLCPRPRVRGRIPIEIWHQRHRVLHQIGGAAAAAKRRRVQRESMEAVAKIAAATGLERQRRRAQHRRVARAAACAACHRAVRPTPSTEPPPLEGGALATRVADNKSIEEMVRRV